MAVAKHNADGSLDNSFAGEGVASFPSGRDFGVARRIDFHGSDGLILAGSIREEGGHADLALLRVRRPLASRRAGFVRAMYVVDRVIELSLL